MRRMWPAVEIQVCAQLIPQAQYVNWFRSRWRITVKCEVNPYGICTYICTSTANSALQSSSISTRLILKLLLDSSTSIVEHGRKQHFRNPPVKPVDYLKKKRRNSSGMLNWLSSADQKLFPSWRFATMPSNALVLILHLSAAFRKIKHDILFKCRRSMFYQYNWHVWRQISCFFDSDSDSQANNVTASESSSNTARL